MIKLKPVSREDYNTELVCAAERSTGNMTRRQLDMLNGVHLYILQYGELKQTQQKYWTAKSSTRQQ